MGWQLNSIGKELLSVAEMGRADELAVQGGVASLDLMEAAGKSVVEALRRRWARRPVVVLCGPGTNGGDGFVIARVLLDCGWPVRVSLLGNRDNLKGDAKKNAVRWAKLKKGDVTSFEPNLLDGAELVIDAMFGAGLTRPLEGKALEIVQEINRRNVVCVAVDMPSGVDGDTGQLLGAAPNAALTVTFYRKKPGHLLLPGKDCCGEVIVTDIGIPDSVLEEIRPACRENSPALWSQDFPRPVAADHKYSRGHALILGGADMTGAARLAARGARRIGAGVVTIGAPASSGVIYRTGDPGNLFIPLENGNDLNLALGKKRRNTILVGPGNGISENTRIMVKSALRSKLPTVLDADAISVFRDDPAELFDWIKGPAVLTPHVGEFGRIFDATGDKLANCRAVAEKSSAVILLKGAGTVIAGPDGRAVINGNGPPALATAGSGDVLAGIIAGLMAQGVGAFDAACMSAWIHGRAAALFGPGLIAEDIPDLVPQVLQEIRT